MTDEIETNEYPIEKTYILSDGEWIEGEPTEGDEFKREVEVAEGTVITNYGVMQSRESELEPRIITKLAFKNRMTQVERIAIRTASQNNPIIFDFLDLVNDAQFIDLSRQDTVEGVNFLESEGLLASGRADEILNAPILDEENLNVLPKSNR